MDDDHSVCQTRISFIIKTLIYEKDLNFSLYNRERAPRRKGLMTLFLPLVE